MSKNAYLIFFSPTKENLDTEEEDIIEDIKNHEYTETLEVIDKENFMLSIGKNLVLVYTRVIVYIHRLVNGVDLSSKKNSNRKVEA